ncbi:hypothetical protein AB0R12_41650, partial [Streptomyces niveus]
MTTTETRLIGGTPAPPRQQPDPEIRTTNARAGRPCPRCAPPRRAWTQAPSRRPSRKHGSTPGRTHSEDLADDVRGPAELAEWERLAQLLADAAPGTVYDPATDDVVQAELAADAAAAAREAELREAARIAARADELQALRELGTLEQTEPRDGDEADRDELTRRAGGYVQADIDGWLAHALGRVRKVASSAQGAGLTASGACDRKAEDRPRTGRTRSSPT